LIDQNLERKVEIICKFCLRLTFIRAGHDFVFCISVLQYTFRTKHFLITLAEEFNLFILVNITHSKVLLFLAISIACSRVLSCHRESSQNCIVHGEILCNLMMSDLIEGAFDNIVFINLFQAF